MVHKNTRSFSNIESCQNDGLKVKVILEHCSQAKYVLPYCDIIQLKLILYGCPCACEWRKKMFLRCSYTFVVNKRCCRNRLLKKSNEKNLFNRVTNCGLFFIVSSIVKSNIISFLFRSLFSTFDSIKLSLCYRKFHGEKLKSAFFRFFGFFPHDIADFVMDQFG